MAQMAPLMLAAVNPGTEAGLSTLLGIGGDVLSGISASKQANYQAALLQSQALHDSFNGQVSAQDTGLANRDEIAKTVLSEASSGFFLGSPAFAQRRAQLYALSNRDQQRIAEDASAKAAVDLANAEQAKKQGKDAIIASIFGIGKDLIGGANLVAKQNTFNTQQTVQDVQYSGAR